MEFADESAGGVFAEAGFGVDHGVDDAVDLVGGESAWFVVHLGRLWGCLYFSVFVGWCFVLRFCVW